MQSGRRKNPPVEDNFEVGDLVYWKTEKYNESLGCIWKKVLVHESTFVDLMGRPFTSWLYIKWLYNNTKNSNSNMIGWACYNFDIYF